MASDANIDLIAFGTEKESSKKKYQINRGDFKYQ